MVSTEIRLIIFFAAKDGEALYSPPYQATEERKHLPQEVRVRNKELTSSHQPGFCRGQLEVSKRWETAVQRS